MVSQAIAEQQLALQGAAKHEQDLAQADALRDLAAMALAVAMGEHASFAPAQNSAVVESQPIPPPPPPPPPPAPPTPVAQRVVAPPMASPSKAKSAANGGVKAPADESLTDLTDTEIDVCYGCFFPPLSLWVCVF